MNITQDPHSVPQYGVFETFAPAPPLTGDPFLNVDYQVTFTRPDGSQATTDGYFDGVRGFGARAYANVLGVWHWKSKSSHAELNDLSGSFTVVASSLKGQLTIDKNDPYQFAYENGDWFLHIGDTGYRYATDTEAEWKAYIDQAAAAGFTKIRTWFGRGRRDVQSLFNHDRSSLNLPFWQEIDRRLAYALNTYPDIMFKLIPYGEDTAEIRGYPNDPLTQWVARYAQARFSAFPNVHWCVSNDREVVPDDTELTGRMVHEGSIHRIARDMAAREPWGSLLTNHQCRFKGYSFCEAEWSDIVTLEDLDQVHGGIIQEYRQRVKAPVVNDEDRYEHYRPPAHPRYFFRRLMWGSLLSGGHATYCGTVTFEPYDGALRGIQGYFDAVHSGKLTGAQDFRKLHAFFNDTGLNLNGFEPDDGFVGNSPERFKCSRRDENVILYLANPDGDTAKTDDVSETIPNISLTLEHSCVARWFDPRSGLWYGPETHFAGDVTVTAPESGDWVLLLKLNDT